MEAHLETLRTLCRLCGTKIVDHSRSKSVSSLSSSIQVIWPDCKSTLDSPNVHPERVCVKCRLFCERKRKRSHSAFEVQQWYPHDQSCSLCEKENQVRKRGRPLENEKRSTQKDFNVMPDEETDSQSEAEDETVQLQDVFYSICMDDLQSSLVRIKETDQRIILDKLSIMNDSVVLSQSMLDNDELLQEVKEVFNLSQKMKLIELFCQDLSVSSTLTSMLEKLIGGLSDEHQAAVVCGIFKNRVQKVSKDVESIYKKYKNLDTLMELEPNKWLEERDPVVCAAVNGLSSESVDSFQKTLALEHLYSLPCSLFVSPFSFMTNISLLAITNSKAAVNIVGKILPGGCYSTLKSWLQQLSTSPSTFPDGDCLVAIDNDQIIPKKWKVKVGQKSRVSVVTSVCQAQVDKDGSLQQQTRLAPR